MAELVGLQSQTPNVMAKLSELLTIRQQRAAAQMAEQDATQRKNIAAYDWNKHIGQDGTIDLDSFANDGEARIIFGDQYLPYLEKAAQAKQQQLAAKDSLIKLRTDQRKPFAEMVGALRSDPDVAQDTPEGRQKVNQAFVQYQQMYGTKDTLPVLNAYGPPLQNSPQGRLSDALKAIQLQAFDAERQVQEQKPQYLNTGAEFTNVNPNVAPSSPIGGHRGNIPTTIAPNTPLRYPGQQEDIARNQQEVAGIRTAADQAPQQRSIFKNILRLADETNTGPLVSYFQNTKIGGQIFGDNFQELGKYLEKNAIANMQAMGAPGSDARLEAAAAANGSTKFNPQALKAVTQFNYATNTALEQYRRGVDKTVGTANPDYTKLADFKSKWAQNFDIDVFRIENAERDGDKKALDALRDEILKTPGRAKELKEKRAALDALGGQ